MPRHIVDEPHAVVDREVFHISLREGKPHNTSRLPVSSHFQFLEVRGFNAIRKSKFCKVCVSGRRLVRIILRHALAWSAAQFPAKVARPAFTPMSSTSRTRKTHKKSARRIFAAPICAGRTLMQRISIWSIFARRGSPNRSASTWRDAGRVESRSPEQINHGLTHIDLRPADTGYWPSWAARAKTDAAPSAGGAVRPVCRPGRVEESCSGPCLCAR